jgi:flagellar biosynthesis GTPase FlhF
MSSKKSIPQPSGKSTQLIFQKINAIIEDLDAIQKTAKNKDQGFMYRGIDQFYNALHPLFAKHGVFSVPNILERVELPHQTAGGKVWKHVTLKVRYDFYAIDGSRFESIVYGEGLDSGDKATNKAIAIAHKYCLMQVFCVPTEEMEDPDKASPPEEVAKRVAEQAKRTAAAEAAQEQKKQPTPSQSAPQQPPAQSQPQPAPEKVERTIVCEEDQYSASPEQIEELRRVANEAKDKGLISDDAKQILRKITQAGCSMMIYRDWMDMLREKLAAAGHAPTTSAPTNDHQEQSDILPAQRTAIQALVARLSPSSKDTPRLKQRADEIRSRAEAARLIHDLNFAIVTTRKGAA